MAMMIVMINDEDDAGCDVAEATKLKLRERVDDGIPFSSILRLWFKSIQRFKSELVFASVLSESAQNVSDENEFNFVRTVLYLYNSDKWNEDFDKVK